MGANELRNTCGKLPEVIPDLQRRLAPTSDTFCEVITSRQISRRTTSLFETANKSKG